MINLPLLSSRQGAPLERPFVLFVSNVTGYRVARIMHGVAQECRRQNLGVLWRDSDYCDLSRMRRPPAGIVAWDRRANVERLRAAAPRVPLVSTIGLTLDMPIHTVAADPTGIANQVAAHLLEEGLRDFLFVGPANHPAAQMRACAFEEALQRMGKARLQLFSAEFDDQFWGADSDRGEAFLAMVRAGARPLGIFAFNDQLAASCMECVDAGGLRVPQDVSIVGVDDHPIYTKMYQPLTSVKIDYEEIGRRAVELIQKLRSAPVSESIPLHHFVGGEELVVRASSRPRLLGDEQVSRALSHVHEHFSSPVTLGELASISGMSRTTFTIRFKRAVRKTPNQYLVDFRLHQARLLLAETKLTISEVAYRVGFSDAGYFARIFKRRCGVTAKDYRESAALGAATKKVSTRSEPDRSIVPRGQTGHHHG